MSLALRVLGARGCDFSRHNETVNNANTGDYNVFYRIEIYQRKGCQTAGALFFMAPLSLNNERKIYHVKEF